MESQRGALAGLHILVAEDDNDAREILRTVLEYFGALVTPTKNARDALRSVRQVRPDVIIADIRLGDHNATWLVREARKIPSRAPVIAVSGLDFDERRLKEQGFSAYLRKPVDHKRLVEVILKLAAAR